MNLGWIVKDNLHNLTPDYKERWRAEGKTRSLLCIMSGEKSGTRSRSRDKVFVGILDTELDIASRLFAEDWRTAGRRQNSGVPGASTCRSGFWAHRPRPCSLDPSAHDPASILCACALRPCRPLGRCLPGLRCRASSRCAARPSRPTCASGWVAASLWLLRGPSGCRGPWSGLCCSHTGEAPWAPKRS